MTDQTILQKAYQKFRAMFFATVIFSFCLNLLMFVGPLYMLQIYDRVLSSRNENTLLMITVISVGLLVVYGVLEFIRSRVLVRAGLQFNDVLATPMFSRIAQLQAANPGGNARSMLQDSDRIRDFLTGPGIMAFFDAPWTPLFLGLCFAFHTWLGVVATIGAVIIFGLALLNEFLTRKSLRDAGTSGQEALQFANAALDNAEVIRALGMEDALSSRWSKKRDQMLTNQARASDWAGVVMSSSKFVRMTLQVAILGTGAYLAMRQEISPGVMIAASILMGRALAPVEQAVAQWKQFVAFRQSDERLRKLFAAIKDEPERLELPTPKGRLSVENLSSFAPGTRTTILKSINFSLEPGEIMALIGPSGSGKTSLARMLVGAGKPVAGCVRLDGTELPHWDFRQLGKSLGYLAQDVNLFSGTVAENIARFDDTATSADVIAAAKLAGAHEMIQELSDGYETQIGNGGMQLSGGQRQRVGLARAVFKMPSLIVLDEPNSNLDNKGELALTKCLEALREMKRTVVVVTHKANLLSVSDKTLILNNGTVQNFVPTKQMLQPKGEPAEPKIAIKT